MAADDKDTGKDTGKETGADTPASEAKKPAAKKPAAKKAATKKPAAKKKADGDKAAEPKAADKKADAAADSDKKAADKKPVDTKKAGEDKSDGDKAAEKSDDKKPAEKPAEKKDLSDLKDVMGDNVPPVPSNDKDDSATAGSDAAGGAGDDAGAGSAPEPPPLREQELDAQGRAYATGRRKDAVARVWVKPGKGRIVVNGRESEVYFARPTLRLVINQPFAITERDGQYDVHVTVKGGGLSGQAGAVKHGISQALTKYEPALRPAVKAAGFLTRDSRKVERKKYGRAKARKSFQFSKR